MNSKNIAIPQEQLFLREMAVHELDWFLTTNREERVAIHKAWLLLELNYKGVK